MMSNFRVRVWLLAAILIAFALRLHQLGAQSLWYDETVSTFLAQQPVPDLLAHTARDIHPPFYYLLLQAWFQIIALKPGFEFVAAFPELGCGLLLLPLTYVVGRRVGLGRGPATLATWLAALSAFQLWYGQEVRMYTLGAILGLLCLWAMWRVLAPEPARVGGESGTRAPARAAAWALYGVAAALGLYTLYYFAFLLVALNAIAYSLLGAQFSSLTPPQPGSGPQRRDLRRRGMAWLAAQLAVLLLFLPWLPVAWRQVTQPPVPPWRAPVDLPVMLRESLVALGFGQSLPPIATWPAILLLLLLGMLAFGLRLRRRPLHSAATDIRATRTVARLAVYTFLPLAMIMAVSLAGTPLYHVRYLFTYAPPFSLVLAAGLAALWQRKAIRGPLLAALATVMLLGLNGWSLWHEWHDPRFAADDHRGAVAFLSSRWRPGDIILVNAGYAYTAFLTYWDQPVSWIGRMTELTPEALAGLRDVPGAVIIETGSIGGSPGLGWGDPRADFFAMSAAQVEAQLALINASRRRLWQYRIYDTVTDPDGVLRRSLDRWTLFEDRVFGGEANLRVQGFWSIRATAPFKPAARFRVDETLAFEVPLPTTPRTARGGSVLDVPLLLRTGGGPDMRPLATSLRFIDTTGEVWAQHDEAVGGTIADLQQVAAVYQPLRVTVPPGTAAGTYRLALVVYDPTTGLPLGDPAASAPVLPGDVNLEPTVLAAMQPALGTFAGQVALVQAVTPATRISPGDTIPLDLAWQAAPAFQPDALVVVTQLLDDAGTVVANREAQPLDGRYGSDRWRPLELVRDRQTVATSATLEPGTYRLVVGLYRGRDRSRLDVACGLLALSRCDVVQVGTVTIHK